MEHKWRDDMMRADFVVTAGPDRPLTIAATIDGTTVEQPETLFAIPGYFVREFFHLAEENERLRAMWTLLRAHAEQMAFLPEVEAVMGCSIVDLLEHPTPPAQEGEEPADTSPPAARE